jgi:hypothetical protein
MRQLVVVNLNENDAALLHVDLPDAVERNGVATAVALLFLADVQVTEDDLKNKQTVKKTP